MSDETPTLACMLVSDGPPKIAGCEKRPCALCEQEVWISPSSIKMMETRELIIACVPCCQKHMEEDTTVEPITKDQKNELLNALFGKPSNN